MNTPLQMRGKLLVIRALMIERAVATNLAHARAVGQHTRQSASLRFQRGSAKAFVERGKGKRMHQIANLGHLLRLEPSEFNHVFGDSQIFHHPRKTIRAQRVSGLEHLHGTLAFAFQLRHRAQQGGHILAIIVAAHVQDQPVRLRELCQLGKCRHAIFTAQGAEGGVVHAIMGHGDARVRDSQMLLHLACKVRAYCENVRRLFHGAHPGTPQDQRRTMQRRADKVIEIMACDHGRRPGRAEVSVAVINHMQDGSGTPELSGSAASRCGAHAGDKAHPA